MHTEHNRTFMFVAMFIILLALCFPSKGEKGMYQITVGQSVDCVIDGTSDELVINDITMLILSSKDYMYVVFHDGECIKNYIIFSRSTHQVTTASCLVSQFNEQYLLINNKEYLNIQLGTAHCDIGSGVERLVYFFSDGGYVIYTVVGDEVILRQQRSIWKDASN